MALWSYDPFSDYYSTPYPRDTWSLLQQDPVSRWVDSPFSSFWPRDLFNMPPMTTRPFQQAREVVSDKDKYQVSLNLGDFKSNEIKVKLVDRNLMVCAEHEEKPDDYGRIYRHIRRRYLLPPNVDVDNLNATLSDNGTLVVSAQKKAIEAGKEREIEVKQLPPQQTSQSTPQVTQKAEQGNVNIPVTRETGKS
ncbi:small heat shock protein OV25-1-like isoform X3 [Daphnia carinata]|uniref:small heat shock protein OV25-1-like isoform X3 n=1 Tax=Daphnia carinata TaxID=120202 RepID=UPI00257AF199|nr:small heat shock protein OV25-1-like isoform X3 [Daphnia carinata]